MLKKILITLIIAFSAFLLILPGNKVFASSSDIEDERVAIEITLSSNQVTINHLTNHDIKYAIVEYAFLDDTGTKISMLAEIPVNNNKFTVNQNVYALKVHQIRILKDRIYYRYHTLENGKNTVGSLAGVKRMNITEIETTAVKTVSTGLKISSIQTSTTIQTYEFYFNFDKEHDKLHYIDTQYIVVRKLLGLIETDRKNIESRVNTAKFNVSGYEFNRVGTAVIPTFKSKSIVGLEANTDNKINANYVARIVPDYKLNGINNDYKIQNFAIIRIAYEIDGEFIIDDVINPPVTPNEPLDDLLNLFERINAFIKKITDFWTSNGNKVLKIILGVALVIAWFILSPIFKIIWIFIKSFFKGIIKILAFFFGWLF